MRLFGMKSKMVRAFQIQNGQQSHMLRKSSYPTIIPSSPVCLHHLHPATERGDVLGFLGSSNAFFLVLDDVISFVEDDQNILDIFITEKGTHQGFDSRDSRTFLMIPNDEARPVQITGDGWFYGICQRSVKRSSMSYLTTQGKLRPETTFSASPLV